MPFLDDFDHRASQPRRPRDGHSEDDQLLNFADLIRAHRAVPSADERARILQRIQRAESALRARRATARLWWFGAAAALLLLAVALASYAFNAIGPSRPRGIEPIATNKFSNPIKPVVHDSAVKDDFAQTSFPAAVLASSNSDAAKPVETAGAEQTARALRVHGLVVYQSKNETRWHILKRGDALKPGDTIRASQRLDSSARILAPDGSAVSAGPGAILHYAAPRDWSLDEGPAKFEAAARDDKSALTAATPDGTATSQSAAFVLNVLKRNDAEPKKNATLCRAISGSVEIAARNNQVRALNASDSAFLNSTGIVSADDSNPLPWLDALANEQNSDHGIGQLVASAANANQHLPLEIASHTVTVTCIDQVARTFVDEVFENNTDRDMEGTFYYPLPADAAISEFAMYIGDKRMVGEVLEQNKARQVYEYIVRQQKDPALLEWAGGNLFKLRIYPIPPKSHKRVQLGYTQILPRNNGRVSYTYPLYSEMLLKNPLRNLSFEFRVLSSAGLADLASPTHLCGLALDPDGRRGTLAFAAKNYSPSRDLSVTYSVPAGAECAAAGNVHADEADPYFMLQLSPTANLPAPKAPERLLVIVDGSASASAQDYAVASEFAASCADVSSDGEFAVLRGGQNPAACKFKGDEPAQAFGKVPLVIRASDASGEKITFNWRQIAGPNVAIADSTAGEFDKATQKWKSAAFFLPTKPGKYEFELTISDERGRHTTKRLVQEILPAVKTPEDLTTEILTPPQFFAADAATSEIVRNALAAKPPLGATDLLATFKKAAEYAADGKPLQIVYVGAGIDVLNELSGPALVEKIAALFKGKPVHLSTVAVGSSYERPVLQGLASALGGMFARVEGAADVHAAVGQVFDSFYRPHFSNARVKIDGIETRDVHSELIGTLAAGDTAIVLGRFKTAGLPPNADASFNAHITFSADTDAGPFERTFDAPIVAARNANNFIPRLWARAHNEARMAQLGLGTATDDARIKHDITENAITYQIMSPFTSYLVLDSEEAYEKYGIQRGIKRVDWMGEGLGGPTNLAREGKAQFRGTTRDYSGRRAGLGGDIYRLSESEVEFEGLGENKMLGDSGYVRELGELYDSTTLAGGLPQSFYFGMDGESDYYDRGDVSGGSFTINGGSISYNLEGGIPVDRLEGLSALGAEPAQVAASDLSLFSDDSVSDLISVSGGRERNVLRRSGLSLDSLEEGFVYQQEMLGRNVYFRRGRYNYANRYFASQVFPADQSVKIGVVPAPFEFKPDQPLKNAVHYQRVVSRSVNNFGARLNWVLALESDENYKRALKELTLLLNEFPANADLKLEQAVLLFRDMAVTPPAIVPALIAGATPLDEAQAALSDALKLSGNDSKMAERIAQVLSQIGQSKLAAPRFDALARAAANADDAAKFAFSAAYAWQSAAAPEKGTALWDDLLKRWPDSALIKQRAGEWMTQRNPNDEHGIQLLRDSTMRDPKSGPSLVTALLGANRKEEALAAARAQLDAAKDAPAVYAILASLHNLRNATAESKRLLSAKCNAAQFGGIAQYWRDHSVKNDKDFIRLLNQNIERADLPLLARAQGAYALASYNMGGMTPEKMFKVFEPLPLEPNSKQEIFGNERLDLATNAIQFLIQSGKNEEALQLSHEAHDHIGPNNERLITFFSNEFRAAAALNKEADFFKRYDSVFFNDHPSASEKDIATITTNVVYAYENKNDFNAAAERVAWFAKLFPNSDAARAMHGSVLRMLAQIQKPDERDKALESLAQKYPSDPVYAELRARSLAQKRKFPDAIAIVRAALAAQNPALTPQRADDERASLLKLLARLSAQDAKTRDAFLIEAAEKEKSQDPVLREWTEAALTCLQTAGEQEKYAGTLMMYMIMEPTDPEWSARLGSALIEMKKFSDARSIYEALSNADPSDAALAFQCRGLSLELNDTASAQSYFDRAFEALAQNTTKLSQFATNVSGTHPDWALKAYERMAKDPARYGNFSAIAMQAANVANSLGRTADCIDWYFKSLLTPDSMYVAANVDSLRQLAQNEREYRIIEPRGREALKNANDPSQKIASHLLLYKLEKMMNKDADARADLDIAAKIDLPEGNYNYLAAAIFAALTDDSQSNRIESYALAGGGAIKPAQRDQLIRTALNYLNNDKDRPIAIRLYRKLLADDDYNADDDRRQLIERLVANGNLDDATVEARKLDASSEMWNVWSAWQRVVETHRNRKDYKEALALSFEMCERLKDDNNYNSNALRELAYCAVEAKQAGKLDAPDAARTAAIFRGYITSYLNGADEYRGTLDQIGYVLKPLGLENEFNALAKQAEESGDIKRISAAARYMNEQRPPRYSDARRIYERALSLDPENREALTAVYDVAAHHVTDWPTALKMLDKLVALKRDDDVWIQTQRIWTLEGLKKFDAARAIFLELQKNPRLLQQNYWGMQNLARDCEKQKDFALAVEVWELGVRLLRHYNGGRIDPNAAAQFYTACGQAYAKMGSDSKALDCYLRGMSVIPRHDQNYKTVLNAALDNVLKGTSLQAAVAAHENNVKSDGNDKPHLRLAFAEAFKKENKTREMLAQLRIAADLLPKDMKLRQEVIEGYKALHDTAAQIDEYRRWSALDPQNIELYRAWGDLYDSLGDRANALLAWGTMAEIRPREAEGYRAYAEKLLTIGEHEKSASAFRQALRYRPTEFDTSNELAGEYRTLNAANSKVRIAKLWTDGEAACRKAMEDLADDPQPWLNLGQFLKAQNKTNEARELYEKIIVRNWPRFRNETITEARKRLGELK
ncbi:MAG TPA: VIT domain-containing protein [Planctomycetota bacterium]|nr:VIT domain-containing protein [Planctomycetota bacterium]